MRVHCSETVLRCLQWQKRALLHDAKHVKTSYLLVSAVSDLVSTYDFGTDCYGKCEQPLARP